MKRRKYAPKLARSAQLSFSVRLALLFSAAGLVCAFAQTGSSKPPVASGESILVEAGTRFVDFGPQSALSADASVTLAPDATLQFTNSAAASWTGRVTGVSPTAGTVNRSGPGDLVLTLRGDNAFGTLTNTNPRGRLVLSTVGRLDTISTILRAADDSAIAIVSGVWQLPNLGINSTGAQMRGTLAISDATVSVANGRYMTGNYNLGRGGTLRVTKDHFVYNVFQCVSTAVIDIAEGGLLDVYATRNGASIGGGPGTNYITIIQQRGGLARVGLEASAGQLNRNLTIGAVSTGCKSAYDLSGGAFLVAGRIIGDTGFNNFNFRGGTLAAATIDATRLGHSTDPADPVANSTSVGTLVNRGGTLAPGDLGIPGKTALVGNYAVKSGALAIDLGGPAPATDFQGATGQHDHLTVSGSFTLGGILEITLVDDFLPAPTDSFTILSAGSIDGAFTNAASGSRLRCRPSGSFLVTVTPTSVRLSDYKPGSAPAK